YEATVRLAGGVIEIKVHRVEHRLPGAVLDGVELDAKVAAAAPLDGRDHTLEIYLQPAAHRTQA
ncbi:MAG: hypothetical protein WC590_13490, partial [Burkholderiaceae bacterium]